MRFSVAICHAAQNPPRDLPKHGRGPGRLLDPQPFAPSRPWRQRQARCHTTAEFAV